MKRWIIGTLSEEALIIVVGFNTYTDVWNVVKKDYAKCFDARGFSFQQQIATIRPDSFFTLDGYWRHYKSICDEIHSLLVDHFLILRKYFGQ